MTLNILPTGLEGTDQFPRSRMISCVEILETPLVFLYIMLYQIFLIEIVFLYCCIFVSMYSRALFCEK